MKFKIQNSKFKIQSFKLLVACFIVLFILACETQEDFINPKNQKHFHVTDKPLQELILNKQFNESFRKLQKSNAPLTSSENAKTALEDQYGFTITNEIAKVIESDNKISYTFEISRENQSETYFENLVIEIDSVNQSKAILLKYTPSEEITSDFTNQVNFKGDVAVDVIDEEENNTENKYIFVTMIGSLCNTPPDCGGAICGFGSIIVVLYEGQVDAGHGGGSGYYGGSSPVYTGGQNHGGSGGGSGSNNTNTTGGVYGNGGTNGTGINTIPIVPSTYNDKFDDFLFDQISNNLIINNNLGPCNSAIINEFKTAPASNPNLARFLDKFNFNTKNPTVYGLEIKIDNLPSPNKSVTNYRYLLPQTSYGDYVIKIDANFSYTATKMAKVRTLVHEIIHAYLISLIDDATVGTGSIDISNYTDLINAIEQNLYGINPSYYQHEAMANRFVGLIANVLKKFDGGTQPNQYYSDLAWGGLQNTDVYKALYPLDTENDQRITAINDAEDTNSNATTPDGITFTPKSQPCN